MLQELIRNDVYNFYQRLLLKDWRFGQPDFELFGVATALYTLMLKQEPNHPEYLSRLAISHHLNGELRTSGQHYQSLLALCPPQPLTDAEEHAILKHAPLLYVNAQECFALMDVVAIHHPDDPIIAYHLFWEDDYDFPDDYEPCDHEEIWVEYDRENPETVKNISCFFHSYVMATDDAVKTANATDGRTTIYVEWGKHGSLLDGWQSIQNEEGRYVVEDIMKQDYQDVNQGGRLPLHPLKRWWPKKFEGTYGDYLDFSVLIDARDLLAKKQAMAKTAYGNAVLQQHFLHYNFHPKYDWPSQVMDSVLVQKKE